MGKQRIRQLENLSDIRVFQNIALEKYVEFHFFLIHIGVYNPHKDDESFKNKIKDIDKDFLRLAVELDDLIETKKNELDKGLSLARIQQFHQFEANESHVEDQCQVCLEEFEVGRLMKQLDCGGQHSFCSVCIDQWFANHKTCPICRHGF